MQISDQKNNKLRKSPTSNSEPELFEIAKTSSQPRNFTESHVGYKKNNIYQRKLNCSSRDIKNEDLFRSLPQEIFVSMLRGLDIKSLFKLKSVAKYLLEYIDTMKEIPIAKTFLPKKEVLEDVFWCKTTLINLNSQESATIDEIFIGNVNLPIDNFIDKSRELQPIMENLNSNLNSIVDSLKWTLVVCLIIAAAVPTGIFSILWKFCGLNEFQLKLSAAILYSLCFALSSLYFLYYKFCSINSSERIV